MVKKIVAIGPESTGKSTLCEQLASHYQTLWCPEFAREYLSEHGMDYSYDDLLTIAKGQVLLEEKYATLAEEKTGPINQVLLEGRGLLFVDTDMYVMKVWCEFVFGKCHPFILDQIAQRKYDLYLLCDVDLEWTPDKLREYPDLERRKELFEMYRKIMSQQPVRCVEINGNYQQRLEKGIGAVDSLLEE
jgi:NadR type nicotinamide-nucleotide adenylyltransferase